MSASAHENRIMNETGCKGTNPAGVRVSRRSLQVWNDRRISDSYIEVKHVSICSEKIHSTYERGVLADTPRPSDIHGAVMSAAEIV